MTTALQALPAVSFPRPRADEGDPFVFHGRRLRAGWALEDTSRFSDDVWNLGQAMLKKHERRFILDFTLIPVIHRQVARELCYAMLSGTVPAGEERPAVGTIRTAFTHYVRFLRWAARAPRLDALTGADLEDFQRFLAKSLPAAAHGMAPARECASSGCGEARCPRAPCGSTRSTSTAGASRTTVPARTPPPAFQKKYSGRCSSGRCASSTSSPPTSSPQTASGGPRRRPPPNPAPTATCPLCCEPGWTNASRQASRFPPGAARPAPPRSRTRWAATGSPSPATGT